MADGAGAAAPQQGLIAHARDSATQAVARKPYGALIVIITLSVIALVALLLAHHYHGELGKSGMHTGNFATGSMNPNWWYGAAHAGQGGTIDGPPVGPQVVPAHIGGQWDSMPDYTPPVCGADIGPNATAEAVGLIGIDAASPEAVRQGLSASDWSDVALASRSMM